MRRPRLAHTLLACLTLGAPLAQTQTRLVDAVEGESKLGTLAVIGPLERPVFSVPSGHAVAIPGLATAVLSRDGDSLEITVSGETFGAGDVYWHVLVDGVQASPGQVRLRHLPDTLGETRTFTFVLAGVAAGRHVVEVRWVQYGGTPVQMRDRALTVQSVSPAWLAVAAGDDRLIKRVTAWTPVPGLATTLETEVPCQLTVTFSGELRADSGRFWARAVVDGAVLQEVRMAESGLPLAPRAFTFVQPKLGPGTHDIRIEYYGEGGLLRLTGRTLSAYAAPVALHPQGGMSAAGFEEPPTVISSSTYVDIPAASAQFQSEADPASMIVSVGAEVRVSGGGRLFLRPVVDDRYAQPGDVEWAVGDDRFRSASFSFAFKNLKPGLHKFRLEAAVDPGSTAEIGDVFRRLVHKRRSGVEFDQPLLHPSETYTQAPRAAVRLDPLVICFDPRRPAHAAPTRVQLENWYGGADGGQSIAGWFAENSAGQVRSGGQERYVGCGPGDWQAAPLAHQGEWYWQNQAWQALFEEALLSADSQVDFHAYDTSHDGELTPDELPVVVLHPQNVPDGYLRAVAVAVDGNPQPMTIHVVQLYLSADEGRRPEMVGLASHELSHAVLHAEDLYGCPTATVPGWFSQMGSRDATHLDPWHKLHSAFVTPALLEAGAWTTRTLELEAVEGGGEVLLIHDRRRGDAEYFVVEQRVPAASSYEDPQADGVVVWRLFDNFTLAQQFPPPGGEACGWDRNSVRRERVLLQPGDELELRWSDGAPAGLKVTLVGRTGQTAQIEVARLP